MIAKKDTKCYVFGPDNPCGLRIAYRRDGDQGIIAYYQARAEHGGWTGILHGGVTFSVMYEAPGWALYYQRLPAVTARVKARFHKPTAVGADLNVRGWFVEERWHPNG